MVNAGKQGVAEATNWRRSAEGAILALVLCALVGTGAGCGWGSPVGLGPDAIELGMDITTVREKMGGAGREDADHLSGTDGAGITAFYWTYDEIRLHFDMNQVHEIYRRDPATGVWVQSQPPLAEKATEQNLPPAAPPTRPVPGIKPKQP